MKKIIMTILVVSFAVFSFAADTAGVNFAETMKAADQQLILNGKGLRKKFVIKVYAAALYLESAESNEEVVLNSDKPMIIRMSMIYDGITPEKMRKSWEEGFEANVADITPLEERIAKMNSWFTDTSKKGDIYDIVYVPEKGTSLIINDVDKGTIEGLDFKKALFSVWLGQKPADKKLKKHMLNQ